MKQNLDKLKKNIDQQFESHQRSSNLVLDVCAVLIENFKTIFDEKK